MADNAVVHGPLNESARRKRLRQRRTRRWLKWVGVAAVAVLLAWYVHRHDAVDVDALMERATTAYDKADYAAAVIDLKTVVKAADDHGAARLLLGLAYLKVGNPVGALKQLERARELGAEAPEFRNAYVRALILNAKYDEAGTELALHTDDVAPDWAVLQGMLELARQRTDAARTIFTEILSKHPEHEESRRGLMQAELAAGDTAAARREVEHLLDRRADDVGLWVIKGQLGIHDRNFDDAEQSFREALRRAPKYPGAILGLSETLLLKRDFDQANNVLDQMGAVDDDPRVSFLRARVAEGRGDLHAALAATNKVLQLVPNHRETLVLAAKLSFSLGEFTRAQKFVGDLLKIDPQNEAAKRMLGAIQLASGRLDGLNELGVDATNANTALKDPGTLALLGTAHLRHGNYAEAAASLERAAELAPDSLPIRTQLALGKMSSGQTTEAVADLERITTENPEFTQAYVMLALAHLSMNRAADAVATARRLVELDGASGLSHNVLGYMLEASGEPNAAEDAYRAALEHDPDFHPARINLARLAMRAKQPDPARQHYQDVLARDANNAFALMGLAALALIDGDADGAERYWQQAREYNDEAVAPRLMLAKHYRAKGNRVLAQSTIKEAYALAPFAPQVQAEYALIMLEAGEFQPALAAAQALAERAPRALAAQELLARIYNQLGDEKNLTATLERMAQLAPDQVKVKTLLGRLALRRKDFAAAQSIIDALEAEPAHQAAALELAGDAAIAGAENATALERYEQAFASAPTSELVLKLDRLERVMGRGGERLAQWLDAHPDDLQVRLVHASQLQQQGAGSAAITHYEQLLSKRGRSPVVLNNLAWLYFERGDERALALAKEANELAPSTPEIMDTYGWILAGSGQREQGLEILTKAMEIAPKNPDIAYHVASVLADTGQTAGALQQLTAVLDEHPEFSLREDAEALLARLQQ